MLPLADTRVSRLTVAVQITMATLVIFIDPLVFGEFSARHSEQCSMSLRCDLYAERLELKGLKILHRFGVPDGLVCCALCNLLNSRVTFVDVSRMKL